MRCQVRGRPQDFAAFDEDPARSAGTPANAPGRIPRRVNLDPEKVERGLTQFVLSVLELIRQLVEKQALRRIEGGSLTPQEVERVAVTLSRLRAKMLELQEHFQIEDLNIDLGPLGNLVDDEMQPGGG